MMVVPYRFITPFVEDFEEEVEEFLRSYGYGDLIENPAPIPIRDIIQNKMMLDIIDSENLSPDYDIQGIISFTEGIVQVYDREAMEYVGYEVIGPSVFVDFSFSDEGYVNRILAHEAFHWYKHRHYFLSNINEKNSGEFAFRCSKKYRENEKDVAWSDLEKMEWQAKKIAPMILLPRHSIIKKIKETTGYDIENFNVSVDQQKHLVQSLSEFYHVTEYTLSSRMIDLGYNIDVIGSKYSADKKSYFNRFEKAGSPVITLLEGFELFCRDASFRELLESNMFRFIDDRFISIHDSTKCLLFNTRLIPLDVNVSSDGIMFRKNQQYESRKELTKQPQNVECYQDIKEHKQQFLKAHERNKKRYVSPNDILLEHMEEKHWNSAIFQEKTLLNPIEYTRVHKPDHQFKLPHLVAIAVGLELNFQDFEEILGAAGIKLVKGDRIHDAYSYLFTSLQGEGIDKCNAFLEDVGLDPLGSKSRDWKDIGYN